MKGHVFTSPIGPVGIAWRDQAICAVQLPAGSVKATWNELAKKASGVKPTEPDRHAKVWVNKLVRHLQADLQDLSELPVELGTTGSEFSQQIYRVLRTIPAGQVVSYQELAERAGRPQAVRAVGSAMGRNPLPLVVPCHRVLASGGELGGFSAVNGRELKQKLLQIEKVFFTPSRFTWDHEAARTQLMREDKKLARLLAHIGPFNLVLAKHRSPYEALFRSIVFQQLNGRAATCILERVLNLYQGFPEPRALLKTPITQLRAQGLSHSKILALRDLAEKVQEGTVPLRFSQLARESDVAIVERLSQVRGIGEWTVQMMLIFSMGRPDVFPVGDFAIRKAWGQIYQKELSPKELLKFSERWAPHRTLVSWFLWRSLDLPMT